eukprot:IDg14571t1
MASVFRFAHIHAACCEFSLFTDHKNNLYMLFPTRFNPNIARHIVHKIQRWALCLSEYNFTVEHVTGQLKTWAEILTRLAAPGDTEFPTHHIGAFQVPLITEDLPVFFLQQSLQSRKLPIYLKATASNALRHRHVFCG